MSQSSCRSSGYTLLEVMLAIVILTAGMLGIYTMLKPASLKAGVEKEQKHLSTLVDVVDGAFGSTQGHYGNLNTSTLADLNPSGVRLQSGNTLMSALGDNMLLRPARVREDNDAFDVVYQNIDSQKCLNYIKSFYPQTYTILVGSSQTTVQQTGGINDGRLVGDDVIASACNTQEFKDKTGAVVFRFFEPRATALSSTDQVCGCTPETQNQTLPCGPGQIGGIQQERTSTCTGGTGACPTAVWTTWSTTSNTCSGAPVPMSLATAVAPSSTLCVSETENRVSSCPAGQTGYITESRTSTCATATSTPVWGGWAVTKDTCTVPTSTAITCTPSTETRNVACPAPQGGQITETRSSTCSSSNATPVWGTWVETSRNCSIACVDTGTCCTPQPDQQRNVNCGAGFWGQTQENRSSYCTAYDATMQWNPWQYLSGSCTACPAPSTATQTQWLSTSASTCPAGQYGGNGWEYEQTRTQTTTYNCPAGTLVLPAPTIGAWTAWSNTGNTRNATSSCTNCPAASTETQTQWVGDSGTCPVGQTGSITWEKEQTRNRSVSYSCPAGTSVLPSPTYGGWSGWSDTGATRNLVNTCVVACSPPASTNTAVTRPAPNETQDVGCPIGWSGNHWQSRPQVENGTQTTSWTCPGPTSSTTTVWHNTFTPTGAGTWTTISNTCAPVCTPPATTTSATTRPLANGNQTLSCLAGQYGAIQQTRTVSENGTITTSWTCPGPTSSSSTTWLGTYNYGAWSTTSNTCTNCPSPSTENTTQWVPASGTCPVGETGSITWEKEQANSRSVSYNCPAGTTSLPAPTYGGWAGWVDTGNTRNLVNTCVAAPTPPGRVTGGCAYRYTTTSPGYPNMTYNRMFQVTSESGWTTSWTWSSTHGLSGSGSGSAINVSFPFSFPFTATVTVTATSTHTATGTTDVQNWFCSIERNYL